MQILTDEGVSKSTVKILQELGQTVVRVQELQLEGAGDTMILERSRAENCVLVTTISITKGLVFSKPPTLAALLEHATAQAPRRDETHLPTMPDLPLRELHNRLDQVCAAGSGACVGRSSALGGPGSSRDA
jgi:hypothetical protein